MRLIEVDVYVPARATDKEIIECVKAYLSLYYQDKDAWIVARNMRQAKRVDKAIQELEPDIFVHWGEWVPA